MGRCIAEIPPPAPPAHGSSFIHIFIHISVFFLTLLLRAKRDLNSLLRILAICLRHLDRQCYRLALRCSCRADMLSTEVPLIAVITHPLVIPALSAPPFGVTSVTYTPFGIFSC